MAQADLQRAAALQADGRLVEAAEIYRGLGPEGRRLLDDHPGPDFLIIGAPRSGSSWLKKVLSQHPQVRILDGEVHYFSMRWREPPAAYLSTFRTGLYKGPHARRTAGPVLFGEKSPTYLAMDGARIGLCAALFPGLKMICNVRDPVERAWSHIKLLGLDPAAITSRDYHKVVKHGRYARLLEPWARHFPPQRLHLVDFADIARDPARVFQGVCRHLGLDPIAPPEALWRSYGAGRSGGPPPDLRVRLEAEYAGEVHDVASLRLLLQAGPPGV